MVAKSKVRAKDKFELMFFVRQKEKEGWSRWGKPYQRTHEGKHYSKTYNQFKFHGMDFYSEWVQEMTYDRWR